MSILNSKFFDEGVLPVYRSEFTWVNLIRNLEKTIIVAAIGTFFSILLFGLDIYRYISGEFFEPINLLNFTTHVFLFLQIIPLYLAYQRLQTLRKDGSEKGRQIILLELGMAGLALVPMGILVVNQTGSGVPFAILILVVNLIFVIERWKRIIFNIVFIGLYFTGIFLTISEGNILLMNVIEALGIATVTMLFASYQTRNKINQFTNQKLLEDKTLAMKESLELDFKKQVTEIEMRALRAQMNPHFLFNVLNSIKLYMVQNEPKTAAKYLTKFAKLIRLILNNSKNKLVVLKDELAALKLYIEIENFRFNDKFTYTFDIEENLDTDFIQIPPLILQPYVENAIWHGLMHKSEGEGQLSIRVFRNQNLLQFEIEDNGIGREKANQIRTRSVTKHQSVGMQITHDRIAITNELFNSKANVQILDMLHGNDKPAGTKVVIQLPYPS